LGLDFSSAVGGSRILAFISVCLRRALRGEEMNFPDRYRAAHPLGFEHKSGDPFGWFMIPYIKTGKREPIILAVQAYAQTEWEHVSVSLRNRCPTWDEMCHIKSLFWKDAEVAVQFHPPKSEHVNNCETCLHLWKYCGEMPTPPSICVGIKKLGVL
jgi:hypothetical protein